MSDAWLRRCGVPGDVAAELALRVGPLTTLGPATTWQVTTELTWSRGWAAVTGFMRRAALAEAGAHLEHLADSKRSVPRAGPGSGRHLRHQRPSRDAAACMPSISPPARN